MEGIVFDVRRFNVGYGIGVNKCYSIARVLGIDVIFLIVAYKFYIGNFGIVYNKGKIFNRFFFEVDIVILLFLVSIRICFINLYVYDIYFDLVRVVF